jgi:putative component of toxin-antitoxin plasmid stabilization module
MDTVLVIALGGGDKSNQQKDIDRAIEVASILKAAQLKATQTVRGKLP